MELARRIKISVFSLWARSALFCLLVSLLLAWALPYGLGLLAHGEGLFEKTVGICCALAAALAFILAAAYLHKTFPGAVYGGRTTYGGLAQGTSSQEAPVQGILSQDTSTQGLPLQEASSPEIPSQETPSQEASSQEIPALGTSPQMKLLEKGFGAACAGILRALFAFSALALLFALVMGLLALSCYALLGGAIDSQALRQGILAGIGIFALIASPFFIHTIFACAFGGSDGREGSGSGAAGSAHRRQRGGADSESETGPGHPGRPGALPKAGILSAPRRFAALFLKGLLPGPKRYLRLLFLSFAFFFLSLSIIWGIGQLPEGAVSAAARLLLLSALAGVFLPLAGFLCGIRPDAPGGWEEGGAGILRGSGSDSAASRAKAPKNGYLGAGSRAGLLESRAAGKAAGRVISIALCFLLIFPLLCEPAKAYADTLEGRPRYVSFPELERNAQAPEAEARAMPQAEARRHGLPRVPADQVAPRF